MRGFLSVDGRVQNGAGRRPWCCAPASCPTNAGWSCGRNRSAPPSPAPSCKAVRSCMIDTLASGVGAQAGGSNAGMLGCRSHVDPHEAASFLRRVGLVLHASRQTRFPSARTASRPRCRPRRTSSRDTGSAARTPRCGRTPATPCGAVQNSPSTPSRPSVSRNATRSSPISRRRIGVPSALGQLLGQRPRAPSAGASAAPLARRPRPGTGGRSPRRSASGDLPN